MERGIGLVLLVTLGVSPVGAAARDAPAIPEDLQETCETFAAAMLEGDGETAIEFYADDAMVLVDHEHVCRGRPAIRDGILAAFGPSFESPDRTSSPPAGSFSCTQVLGFSQSMEWYAGLSVADYLDENARPDLSALERDAFLPTWQGRFFIGAVVDKWTDPGFTGWAGTHRWAHETPAHCERDEVDRVVFNVSGEARSPQAWAAAVDSVAVLIRAKFPAVRRVVMQPVVGAPEGECTDVRAARNHPVIVEGIRRAADRGGITAGPSPRVADCGQFSDALGHLTVEGAEHVRGALREHYRSSSVGSDRRGSPDLYALDLEEDGGPVRLTRREGVETVPDVSPDARWVVFVSDRGGMADEFLLTDDPQPYGDIWAVPVEGGEAVRLTDDKWEDGLPRWGALRER